MRKAAFIIAACILLAPSTFGQLVRINGKESKNELYLDLGRVWSYNLYEQSRWGAGLEWRTAGETWQMASNIYLGYSGYAKLWSGGASGKLTTAIGQWSLGASRDLVAVGSRRLSGGSFSDPGSLAAFMTRRMSERHTLAAGYSRLLTHGKVLAGLQLFHGYRLYDSTGLLYAKDGSALPREDGWEATMGGIWREADGALSVQCKFGELSPGGRAFLRIIGQYENEWHIGLLKTSLFVQGGMVNAGAPYPCLFDLGGTWGAPFCFNNTLLTARPNEFTADIYTFAGIRIETTIPFYKVYDQLFALGSVPVPFVGLNVAWGMLRGMDDHGVALRDGLMLQAPYLGIVEPVIGIDGLLRWGVVDWGLAAAYRIVPYGAAYRDTALRNNLSLMVTAKLLL